MENRGLRETVASSSGISDEPASSSTSWPAAATGNEWWESPQVVTSISSVNLLLIIVSAAANSIVMVLFCVSRTLRKPQNLFTFNLALSDLLVAVFCGVVESSIFETVQPEPNPVTCIAVAVVITSSFTCAISSIAMIALLRYVGIVRTSLQVRLNRWTVVVPLCIGFWVSNYIILTCLIVTDQMQAIRKPVTRQCSFDFSYNRTFNEAAAVITIVQILMVAGAYASIYRFVQQSKARVKGHTSSNNEAEQTRSLRQEMRLVAPMLAIFLCYCGSWTSYFVVDVFLDPTELHHPWSHVLTQFILLLNTIADPVICVVFNHVYRDQFQRLLQRCTGHQQWGTARGGLSRGVRTLDTISRGHNMLTAAVSIEAVEVATAS